MTSFTPVSEKREAPAYAVCMETTPHDDGPVVLRACLDCDLVDEFSDRIASRGMPCAQANHRTSIIVARGIGTDLSVDDAFKMAISHAKRAYSSL